MAGMGVAMREHAVIIVNPASGRATAADLARRVAARLYNEGLSVDVLETVAPGHARSYAMRLDDDVDVVVSVGGDGTLNEVVNGVLDAESGIPVALVPSGTANVVARELGLPQDLDGLARVAHSGPVRSIDLGLAGDRRFIMCAGIGFDAQIVELVSQQRGGDGIIMLNYALPAMQTLMGYHYPPMTVEIDGSVVDDKATFVVIGNMRRYGGPFRLFRRATPDDGRLDICCLHGDNVLDLLRYGWSAFWHALPDELDVSYHSAEHCLVRSGSPVLVQVDGDRGGSLPMEFRVLPAAVNFCVSELDPHGESPHARESVRLMRDA